jgi:hypothetical protein
VRELRLKGFRYRDDPGAAFQEVPGDSLVRVFAQTPNPDYPKTTPKGGTGKGLWIRTPGSLPGR